MPIQVTFCVIFLSITLVLLADPYPEKSIQPPFTT